MAIGQHPNKHSTAGCVRLSRQRNPRIGNRPVQLLFVIPSRLAWMAGQAALWLTQQSGNAGAQQKILPHGLCQWHFPRHRSPCRLICPRKAAGTPRATHRQVGIPRRGHQQLAGQRPPPRDNVGAGVLRCPVVNPPSSRHVATKQVRAWPAVVQGSASGASAALRGPDAPCSTSPRAAKQGTLHPARSGRTSHTASRTATPRPHKP